MKHDSKKLSKLDARLLFENNPFETKDSPLELKVKGELPDYLFEDKGSVLIQNGPGHFTNDARSLFDIEAKPRSFLFRDGSVSFSWNFLQSKDYKKMKDGKIRSWGFLQRPDSTINKIFTTPSLMDNAAVNVFRYSNKTKTKFIAQSESPRSLIEVNPITLESCGRFQFQDNVSSPLNLLTHIGEMTTGHAVVDERGTTNLITRLGRLKNNSKYIIYEVPHGSMSRRIIGEVTVDKPAYMHSLALTKNYAIITEGPQVLNSQELIKSWVTLRGKPLWDFFNWEPKRGTRYHVINRNNGEVNTLIDEKAMFFEHHGNSFEEDENIKIDLTSYTSGEFLGDFTIGNLKKGFDDEIFKNAGLDRVTLNLKTKRVSSENIQKGLVEFPRFNESRIGLPYRFLYTTEKNKGSPFLDTLVKRDMKSFQTRKWYEEGCFVGEPIHIKNPTSNKEDNGVIVSTILDAKEKESFLLVLDAQTFKEQAKIYCTQPLNMGFHGNYFKL